MSYTYRKILSSETIGDSLSAVNYNYLSLETETLVLKLSTDTLWIPMQQYYLQYGATIKDAVNTINTIAPALFDATTIVQNNSAGWIKPITIFYPNIFSSSDSNFTIFNTISSWVQLSFPVIPNPVDIIDNNTGTVKTVLPSQPSYVQNQIMIVYAHTWGVNSNPSGTTILTDSTTCYSHDEKICVSCSICYYGGTFCGEDTWVDCGGNCTSCQTCGELSCNFAAPPYTSIGDHVARSSINANINIQYQDVGELQNLNAFVFSVQDCNWVLQRNLGG